MFIMYILYAVLTSVIVYHILYYTMLGFLAFLEFENKLNMLTYLW